MASAPAVIIRKRRLIGHSDQQGGEFEDSGFSGLEAATEAEAEAGAGPTGGRTFLVARTENDLARPPQEAEDTSGFVVHIPGLPPHIKPVPEPSVDLAGLMKRLEFMAPAQALAWLILTPEGGLKPLDLKSALEMIRKLLSEISADDLHRLRPASVWIREPYHQIQRYTDGQLRRPVEEQTNVLPGQIGAWVTAHKLTSTESGKRSVNAQRINAISLAGLIIASNRFEVMEWMTPEQLDPIRPAAFLGCSKEFEGKGHNVGEISGYALGLISHSAQFFSWVVQWQPLLEEIALSNPQEISRALMLAVRVWSAAHGELEQSCAERAAIMLQLGATMSESSLKAFAPNGRRDVSSAVAWARFCTQTFGIDRRGRAAKRMMESARSMGYSLAAKPGEAQAMTPYAVADLIVGSSRVDLQACKLEYSIVSPK